MRHLANHPDTSGPLWKNVEIVELDERHGYGYALRHALRHCVQTPYVCVIQHDRTLMRPTPIAETVHAMWLHTNVKYVGFTCKSNLFYKDIFRSKYHADAQQMQQWDNLVLRLPQLALPAETYGPASATTSQSDPRRIASYRSTAQGALTPPSVEASLSQCTLLPTLFWYDNVHICETAQYRDFVFHPTYVRWTFFL